MSHIGDLRAQLDKAERDEDARMRGQIRTWSLDELRKAVEGCEWDEDVLDVGVDPDLGKGQHCWRCAAAGRVWDMQAVGKAVRPGAHPGPLYVTAQHYWDQVADLRVGDVLTHAPLPGTDAVVHLRLTAEPVTSPEDTLVWLALSMTNTDDEPVMFGYPRDTEVQRYRPGKLRSDLPGPEMSAGLSDMLTRSGVNLTAACKGLGLPHSGTKRVLARRLLGAGLTATQVRDRYGWKARHTSTP